VSTITFYLIIITTMTTTKLCRVCGQEKLVDEFNRDSSKRDGRQNLCRVCKRANDRKYVALNKVRNNERAREWRKNNKERASNNVKRWIANNLEKRRESQRKYGKIVHKRRGWYKNLFTSIKRALKNGWPSKKIFDKLGYTPDQLRAHLESKFKDGMTWENHGEWHIDHIIPRSWLPFDSPDDENFMRCWSLNNLQPLWARDNSSKQDRYAG